MKALIFVLVICNTGNDGDCNSIASYVSNRQCAAIAIDFNKNNGVNRLAFCIPANGRVAP
jgi:hypothetical protein